MANAKRDGNSKPVMLGVSSVDLVTPIPLKVDPVTGFLLVKIVDTNLSVNAILRANAKFDENHKPTMLGWNGSNTQALITHNGYLGIRVN